MTEFECLLTVRIHADDGISLGESLMVLPFAPFEGLRIDGIQPDLDAVIVKAVVWDPTKQSFVLYLEDDVCDNHHPDDDPFMLDQLKSLYDGEWTWTDEAKPS
jgi:hypothetical protein